MKRKVRYWRMMMWSWGLDIFWWLGHIFFQGIPTGAAGWHCPCFKHSYKPTCAAEFLYRCLLWMTDMQQSQKISCPKSYFCFSASCSHQCFGLRSGFANASHGPSCRNLKVFHWPVQPYIWLLYNARSIRLPMLPVVFSQGQTVPYTACPQRLPAKMCWS